MQSAPLYPVIDDRHGRASTIIATQLPVDCWHDMIGDPTYADAILDRLVHNAYRLVLKGKTMRPGIDQLADDGPEILGNDIAAADG